MLPYGYEKLNLITGTQLPSTVKPRNNLSFDYWSRSLIQRAASVIDFTIPWTGSTRDFFIYCLMRIGFVAIFDTEQYGIIWQPGSLAGYNVFYQPTKVLISNPVLKAQRYRKLKIGKTCEILKLTPDYFGIWDIITYYAEKLSSLDNAISIAIANSKIGWILGASSKSAAQTIKKAIDLIDQGNPAVVFDQKKLLAGNPNTGEEPWKLIDLEVKKNYILTDLLNDFQTILNNFDAEIGIPTIPYQKKERLVTSEADSRVIDSMARANTWIETLNSSAIDINDHYNLDLNFKLAYKPESEVQQNVNS